VDPCWGCDCGEGGRLFLSGEEHVAGRTKAIEVHPVTLKAAGVLPAAHVLRWAETEIGVLFALDDPAREMALGPLGSGTPNRSIGGVSRTNELE